MLTMLAALAVALGVLMLAEEATHYILRRLARRRR
jgi:hypothetical protein